jgi:serine/threonine protein kinase/tetratricopeptide (TPR) repeat protein
MPLESNPGDRTGTGHSEERRQAIERIFEAAIDAPPEERRILLRDADSGVREGVEQLLRELDEAGDFLESPAIARVFSDAAQDEQETSFRAGDVLLKRFRIVGFLARGGMGEVYEAEDLLLGNTRIALKTIALEKAGMAEMKARFKSEVILARQIRHPNICPIYDMFEEDGPAGRILFFTMKFVPGETLSSRLKKNGPMAAAEAVAVFRQVTSALGAAHQAGIVHRDFKPGNVLLEGRGPALTATVTDFGIAREQDATITAAGAGGCPGTPGYIAPELLAGSSPTPVSDIYALGVVFHEMLTGIRPGPGAGGMPGLATRMPAIPENCRRVLKGCLQEDPALRYRTAHQVLSALDGAHIAMPHASTRGWSRRKLMAGGAVALAGSAAVYWRGLLSGDRTLPQDRFVALMAWPPSRDPSIKPLLNGVLDAIENTLTRAEASDRRFLLIPARDLDPEGRATDKLAGVRDALGVNLVLAASGVAAGSVFGLLLQVIDPTTSGVLRRRTLSLPVAEISGLPQGAARAASEVLGIGSGRRPAAQPAPQTESSRAFRAFESAEELMRQPNDAGVDAALEKYKEALEADPRYAAAYARLATAYARQYVLRRDPVYLDLARRNAEVALRQDPPLPEARLALAMVLSSTGKDKEALAEIAEALRVDPLNSRLRSYQALVYRKMGRWEEAEAVYRRILKDRPNYWPAYNELGWALYRNGRYREAAQAFHEATAAAPKSALAYNNLGSMYLALGQFSEASANFQRSLALNPNGNAYSNTATALFASGKHAAAAQLYRKALELEPRDEEIWRNLGDCYSLMPGEEARAAAAYARAAAETELRLKTDPTEGAYWMKLALYRLKSGNRKDALRLSARAESLGAKDLQSQFTKAQVLEILGDRKSALRIIEACFARGLTEIEVRLIPDLSHLREDPAYLAAVKRAARERRTQTGGD